MKYLSLEGSDKGGCFNPSAAVSRVLQRPSGDSMLAAVSMTRVDGSRVNNAAVMMPLEHLPCCSMALAREMADSEDEQAVSMLTEGPMRQKADDQRVLQPDRL